MSSLTGAAPRPVAVSEDRIAAFANNQDLNIEHLGDRWTVVHAGTRDSTSFLGRIQGFLSGIATALAARIPGTETNRLLSTLRSEYQQLAAETGAKGPVPALTQRNPRLVAGEIVRNLQTMRASLNPAQAPRPGATPVPATPPAEAETVSVAQAKARIAEKVAEHRLLKKPLPPVPQHADSGNSRSA